MLFLSNFDSCYIVCPGCGNCDEEIEFGYFYLLEDEEGAERLRYYFGTYVCPECGKKVPVLTGMEEYFLAEQEAGDRVKNIMEIVRRGYEPKDAIEFGPKSAEKLSAAAQELLFLANRGYGMKSASTFVGNHHLLSERQRLALVRSVSPQDALLLRKQKQLYHAPESLVLDGFNTIITLEVALSGSLLLAGMDGTIRDLAGLRGSYRIVDKTVRAVELLLDRLEELGVKDAMFYLDQQVSNSGRLRALLLGKAASRGLQVQVELHPSVDSVLSHMENVVTTDAIILDKCCSWYNLNRGLIEQAVPDAWIFRLDGLPM